MWSLTTHSTPTNSTYSPKPSSPSWRQQRIWLAEAAQIEIAIAQGESELRKSLPRADAKAHLANGIAKSEAVLELYLRYDAQLHRYYRNCLKDLPDLQALRLPPDDAPSEPKPPTRETVTTLPIEPDVCKPEPELDEPTLPPEQAPLAYMQSEIQRFEDYQAQVFRASFRQSQPESAANQPDTIPELDPLLLRAPGTQPGSL